MKKALSLLATLFLILSVCVTLSSCSGELLQSKTLEVEGTSILGTVGYEVKEFNFSRDITVQNFASFTVSYDKYGTDNIASKIAPLELGSNNFYIHVSNSLGKVTTYGVSILRSNIEYVLNSTGDSYSVSKMHETTDDTIFTLMSTYNGLPVTSIGERAFENCSRLESIVIPKSVEI